MSDSYQIKNQTAPHFLTVQIVGWADVFTRAVYKDIIIDSFRYCRTKKDLWIHAYVIMSNHIHCVLSSESNLSSIVRDFKKFTSKSIFKAIETENESRREWLMMMIFKYHAKFNKRTKEM